MAGLLWVYPALSARLPRTRPKVLSPARDVAVASFAATLATLPIVAAHFQRISWIGIVANVPAAPLSSFVLVPLALVGGLVAIVLPAVGAPILAVAAWAADALMGLARWSAAVPGATSVLPAFGAGSAALYYAALAGILVGGRGGRRAAVACGAALVLVLGMPSFVGSRSLTLTFLPVGQGDAAVIEFPNGRAMLVDTGPAHGDRSAVDRVVLPFLRHRGIRRLDWLVLSHPHADHVGGLQALFEAMPIGEIWWNGDLREGARARLGPVLDRTSVQVRAPRAIQVGDADVRVLAPGQPVGQYGSVNDASVVLAVTLGMRRFILAGDAEAESERRMIARYASSLRPTFSSSVITEAERHRPTDS